MERVLSFLGDLAANNHRDWFNDNKPRHKEAEGVFGAFAERLLTLIGEFDEAVRGLTLRDVTYRIYRDIRFSHDKTPYKTHMGAYICPGGKKSGNAGYYFHIQPFAGTDNGNGGTITPTGNHLMDAGIYMPERSVLKSVRDEIFDNSEAVLTAIARARTGTGSVRGVGAGFELDRSNSLKRTPTGYPTGSEMDEYLKLNDFHLSRPLDEAYILAPRLAERAAEDFRTTYDFVALMNRAARFAHEEG
jgi:uncharacterized protein (TIGR02453 family)